MIQRGEVSYVGRCSQITGSAEGEGERARRGSSSKKGLVESVKGEEKGN